MDSIVFDGIEYKPYNHLYAVSKCGKFLRNLKPITPIVRPDGYLSVGRQQLAHRLVASVWCFKPEGATHVHHINHIRDDNRANNLEWVSPEQHREFHPSVAKGHRMSEAGKAKLRAIRLGSKTSEETKQKQREAALRLGCKPPARAIGTKMSEASKKKMRDNSPNARSCVIFGIHYSSVKSAAEALGMKRLTVRKRLISPNFTEYQYSE